mmetsp:Transcript_5942/g.9901  ORF Transcript_5942/g.9901 Transcript_5942/m.9901 type:complete len:201 (+) Transcript_5942:17-619(+)
MKMLDTIGDVFTQRKPKAVHHSVDSVPTSRYGRSHIHTCVVSSLFIRDSLCNIHDNGVARRNRSSHNVIKRLCDQSIRVAVTHRHPFRGGFHEINGRLLDHGIEFLLSPFRSQFGGNVHDQKELHTGIHPFAEKARSACHCEHKFDHGIHGETSKGGIFVVLTRRIANHQCLFDCISIAFVEITPAGDINQNVLAIVAAR